MKRKLLAVLLALSMVISACPSGVFASGADAEVEAVADDAGSEDEGLAADDAESEDEGLAVTADAGSEGEELEAADDGSATSGQCGDNVTYAISGSTLTISGTGAMYNYDSSSNLAPWFNALKNNTITEIVIEEGVTSIGEYAFSLFVCQDVEDIDPSDDEIDPGTFVKPSGDTELSAAADSSDSTEVSVSISSTVTSIGEYAFYYNTNLREINIPIEMTYIFQQAFFGCSSLKNVYYKGTASRWSLMEIETGNDNLTNATFSYTTSGKCGENLTYAIDGTTLTISGTGDMYDYGPDYWELSPWFGDLKDNKIAKIIIENGVSSIGKYAFSALFCEPEPPVKAHKDEIPGDENTEQEEPENNTLSATADTSGDIDGVSAQDNDSSEELLAQASDGSETTEVSISIASTVKTIGAYAFYLNKKFYELTIPTSVTSIGQGTFSECTGLKDVYYLGTSSQWSAINIADDNQSLTNATLHCTELTVQISACTVTLDNTAYTYDGTAKQPTVTVKNGTTTLAKGTDYSVAYSNNTNAGTATVKITGSGNYTGTVTKTFTIAKAAAGLSFASATISKKTTDTSFTNALTKKSDGTVSYASSDTSVATVSSSGTITIKGAGTTTITASTAATTNYAAGKAEYSLTVVYENIYNWKEETYSFNNYRDDDSSGHCFGMSMTSAGYYLNKLNPSNIGLSSANLLYTVSCTGNVKKAICDYQNKQMDYSKNAIVAGGSHYITREWKIQDDWDAVVNYVKEHKYDNSGELQIAIRGEVTVILDDGTTSIVVSGHAINFLYYEKTDTGEDRLYAYDNNFPNDLVYLTMNSYGNVIEAPKRTTVDDSGCIKCIALRSVDKYFDLVSESNNDKVIYAEPDEIYIPNVMPEALDGETNYAYDIDEDVSKVNIIPLKDNAEFSCAGKEYSFGKISNDTYGVLKLESTDEAGGDAADSFAVKTDGRINIDPCYYGHTYASSTVTLEPTCGETGIRTYTCTICNAATKEEIIPATGKHTVEKYQEVKPSTSGRGYIIYKCTSCGNLVKTVPIAYPKTYKLSASSYTYDGKVKTPTLQIYDSDGKLISASNYTIKYPSGRKNVGAYSYTVTFNGKTYTGTKTVTFNIVPKKAAIKSVKVGKQSITVNASAKAASLAGAGYQIEYRVSGTSKWSYTTTTAQSKKLTKLTKGKKYQIAVRAYKKVGKTTLYGPWSAAKTSGKVK